MDAVRLAQQSYFQEARLIRPRIDLPEPCGVAETGEQRELDGRVVVVFAGDGGVDPDVRGSGELSAAPARSGERGSVQPSGGIFFY